METLHARLLRPLISDLFSDGAAEVTAGRLQRAGSSLRCESDRRSLTSSFSPSAD